MVKLTIRQTYNEVVFEFNDITEAADYVSGLIRCTKVATKYTIECAEGEEEVTENETI